MQAQDNGAVLKKRSLDVIQVRRNPYLVDYEEQRRLSRAVNASPGRPGAANGRNRRAGAETGNRHRRSVEVIGESRRRESRPEAGNRHRRSVEVMGEGRRRESRPENGNRRRSVEAMVESRRREGRPEVGKRRRSVDIIDIKNTSRRNINMSAGRGRNPASAKKAMRRRRRKQMLHRRMMIGAWLLCLFMTGWLIQVKRGEASSAENGKKVQEFSGIQEESPGDSSAVVQGLSAKVYAKHPAWTENFLSPNEYSRPGEPLTQVKDIFVHYTANAGTSAAQNRSYFEQQKDMHEASVSAHFIIGYNGEIIQCVPLNEIAYAVQTRNYDSISIECCYKAADGSFTQETYDSLISLLAWLTDAYDLDTEHILRHYDCGGKKCPIYYTEHVDAWVRLKKDVAGKRESSGNII